MEAGAYEFAKNLAREHAQVIPVSLFVAVLCLCLVIGHLFEENRWVNESITAIIIVFTYLINPIFFNFICARVLVFTG